LAIVARRKHSGRGRREGVTNLEAAKALGVQISHNLLSLADDVIE
jgi:hypothetical protein